MSVVGALVGHLVGDYLLQNDFLASGKKRSSRICVLHALIWTISVCAFADWHSLSVFLFLLLTHFAQDRTDVVARWMDLVGQKGFRTGVCAPWSAIVVDNAWHVVQIYVAWAYLGFPS